MASLSEMVAAAQVTQQAKERGNPVANRLLSFMDGVATDRARAQQEADLELDRYKKILDIKAKMIDVKREREKQEVFGNMAKVLGLMGLDEGEDLNSRITAGRAMGGKKAPLPNTKENRMLKFLEENEGASVSYGPEGLRVRFQGKSKKGAGDVAARQARVLEMATEAARREVAQKEGVDPLSGKPRMPRNDEVMKYLGAFESFLGGNTAAAQKGMKRVRQTYEPFDILGDHEIDLDIDGLP